MVVVPAGTQNPPPCPHPQLTDMPMTKGDQVNAFIKYLSPPLGDTTTSPYIKFLVKYSMHIFSPQLGDTEASQYIKVLVKSLTHIQK